MAVAPFSTGAGSVPGQVSASSREPSRSRTNGPSPLAENTIGRTVARGTMPSDVAFSVVSTGAQESPLRTRVGSIVCSSVSEPSTLRNVCDHSVRAESNSTRRLQTASMRRAAAASGCSSIHAPFGGAGAAAAALAGTASRLAATVAVTAPVIQPRKRPLRVLDTRAGNGHAATSDPRDHV
ncbi:hypothetical protein EFE23_16535 [Micromonospora solifontis]|uniref:Uncharacterized protein n=1 Tax=Micromonospora solifontis TaxID=2487138 RepID=A0ABX9WDW1_9ACTN|nr:hypothetical protein EFE23_16535 [Micromonospora solifontis]